MVLAFHVALALSDARPAALPEGPLRWAGGYGFLGVDVFFVVSGYCIAAAAASIRGASPRATFLYRRARRIYPTYWAAMAVAAAVGVAGIFLAHNGVAGAASLFTPFSAGWHWVTSLSLLEAPLKTFGVDPRWEANPPLWSLCYEVQFYAWAGFALVARTRRAALAAVVATTAAAILLRAVPAARPRGFLFDLWIEFAAGLWLFARTAPATRATTRRGLDAAFAAAVALEVLAFRAAGQGFPQDAKRSLFAAGVAVVLAASHPFDAHLSRSAPVRALSWVGRRSYSLYLVHFPLVATILPVAVARGWTRGAGAWAWALVASAVALAAATAFHALVERRFVGRRARASRVPAGTRPAQPAAAGG